MVAPTPEVGEHTDEILQELDYSARRDLHAEAERHRLSESRIIERKEGAVGWLVFSNPAKRNAMSVNMWEAIPPALERFGADPEIRVVALAGEGDKAFVSGADISQFETQRSAPEAVQRYEEISEGAQRLIHEFDKPMVAMMRGYCLGGGVNIALACDLRIAADDARFGIPAARMGLGYRASSLKNLVDTVGAANAREFLITARQFTAAEALHIGLVHQVVPVCRVLEIRRDKYLDRHRRQRAAHHALGQAHHPRAARGPPIPSTPPRRARG